MIDRISAHCWPPGRRYVLAVTALVRGLQLFVLRQPIPHLNQVLIGFAFVVAGLAFFLMGLEMALFPLGEHMATELSSPSFRLQDRRTRPRHRRGRNSLGIHVATIVGFSTTLAEPALIASRFKANKSIPAERSVRGDCVWSWPSASQWGVTLGTFRIVTGTHSCGASRPVI